MSALPVLVWDLITLAQRIFDMVRARNESEDIKADARDQLEAAIDKAVAMERLRVRQQEGHKP